ncbi:hypothetical protein SLS60_011952 [Paraconiothyrium brasiliense]|uniref:Uncharacterized protein n=1 Tax=Paraconiothyrium brasiliense TaxID=300254 RepID=A0ABR3QHM3_9PLEO
MSGQHNGDASEHVEPDFAQAFKELARGEGAATALENHLDALEKKIEEMLAKAEEDEKDRKARPKPSAADSSSNDESRPAA